MAVRAQEKIEYLAVADIATRKISPTASFTNLKLLNFWWKADDLILLLLEDDAGFRTFRTVNLKTQKTSELYNFNHKENTIINTLPDDPDNILVATGTSAALELRRLNVRTGKTNLQPENAERIWRWVTNRKGETVAALGWLNLGHLDKKWFMLLPGKDGKRWRRVELGDKSRPDFFPLSVAPDQTRVLGLDYTAGNTTTAVIWNPVDDTKETAWRSDKADALDIATWGDDPSARAIIHQDNGRKLAYLTSEDDKLGQAIDQALPGTDNYVASISTDRSRLIIRSLSASKPPRYFLLDRKNSQLADLGTPYPQLEPLAMAPVRHFTATSTDGLEIHALIYQPQKAANPPPAILVANVHSAPPGTLYNPINQYLASRGYAVIEVDQRGTWGYGLKYAVAGDKQIATGMPDDYAAVARQAAQEGWVDGHRIALMGISRAGLVSLHTLARHPGLFAAWINLGVPIEGKTLDVDDVLFGRYSEKDSESLVGNANQAENYLRTLDGYPLLQHVQAPSLHFYPRESYSNTLISGGDKVEKFFARAQQPHSFIKGSPTFSIRDLLDRFDETNRLEVKRVYEQLTAFLDENLPAGK